MERTKGGSLRKNKYLKEITVVLKNINEKFDCYEQTVVTNIKDSLG